MSSPQMSGQLSVCPHFRFLSRSQKLMCLLGVMTFDLHLLANIALFILIWLIYGKPSINNMGMPDIWQTVPDTDSWTITIKQNVHFQEGIYEQFQLG